MVVQAISAQEPPQKGVTIFGVLYFYWGRTRRGRRRDYTVLTLFVCLRACFCLLRVCWLKKESQRTNQSPTTQRCGCVNIQPQGQSPSAWNAQRQQQQQRQAAHTHKKCTTKKKKSFSSGSCVINSRLDFLFFVFLSLCPSFNWISVVLSNSYIPV